MATDNGTDDRSPLQAGGKVAASAHDVERELRARLPGIGDVRLHKLLYYCQGFHATWVGPPLFREEIEAWKMGPVVADLWRHNKYGLPMPSPVELDENAQDVITFVVETYGRMNAQQLIAKTHEEAPWEDAYSDWPEEITVDSLRRFFSSAGPRGATLHWLDRYRQDPDNEGEVVPPSVNSKPDSMGELRRLRAAARTG